MQRSGVSYIVGFSAVVCLICSLLVSAAAVLLKDRQVMNAKLDKQMQVLSVSGLLDSGQRLGRDEIQSLYESRIRKRLVDLSTGEYVDDKFDVAAYDQLKASKDPEMGTKVPSNPAGIARIPKVAAIFQRVDEQDNVELLILPIKGKGLWSTLYGFLALAPDLNTVKGITFYQHGETPGLGGEVDNPRWKSRWPGRKVYDDSGKVALSVIKGPADAPADAPYKVDGLSGATITSTGVSNLIHFWMGENGFKPFLKKLEAAGSAA